MSAPSASKRRQRYDALGATYGDVEDQELSADDQIEKNKQLLMQQVVELETRVADLVTVVATKTSEKNAADSELQALRAQIEGFTSQNTEVQAALQESQQNLAAVQAESKEAKTSLATASTELGQVRATLQASQQDFQTLQVQNAAVQQSLEAANVQKASVESELQSVQSELATKTAESQACTEALEAIRQTLSDLQAQNDALTSEVAATTTQLQTLTTVKETTDASLAEAQQQLTTVSSELGQLRATAGKQTSDNSELQRVQDALMAQITATVQLLTDWPTTDPGKTAPLIDKLMLYAPTSLWSNDLSVTRLKTLPPIVGILASIATELNVVETLKVLGNSAPTATAGGAGAASAQTAAQTAMLTALNGYEARLVGFKRIVRRQARKLREKVLSAYTAGPNPQSRADAVHLYYQMTHGASGLPPGSEGFLQDKHDIPESKENDDAKRKRGGAVSGDQDDYEEHGSDSDSEDDAGGGKGNGSSDASETTDSNKRARTTTTTDTTTESNAAASGPAPSDTLQAASGTVLTPPPVKGLQAGTAVERSQTTAVTPPKLTFPPPQSGELKRSLEAPKPAAKQPRVTDAAAADSSAATAGTSAAVTPRSTRRVKGNTAMPMQNQALDATVQYAKAKITERDGDFIAKLGDAGLMKGGELKQKRNAADNSLLTTIVDAAKEEEEGK